ncbi:MAG: CPBP family intramembrane metalloprotease [Oscillospiraceae bacterium]|nr:CPBP family intramembrane metalloprotease [Oscillospiraceae bacterium]
MKKARKEQLGLIAVVIICCIIMALFETVIEPAYWVKSAAKVTVFLLLPLIIMKLLKIKVLDNNSALNKKDIIKLLLLGFAIYAVIIGVYFLTRNIFDYSSLVNSQMADQKVDKNNFIWVALYISFGNSFLEEFLFRFTAFLKLSGFISKKFAYIFSSVMFAVYHIAMIGSSFPLPLLILALIGLTAGGLIFDYVDDKNKNIYNSWIVHMFADLAIVTIWYIHI